MAVLSQEETLLEQVVSILRHCGVNAGWQDTGGRTYCVVIAEADVDLDEPKFWFGTAGESWAGQIEGESTGLWTDVASDEDNPTQVARGILEAITRFSQNQA